MSQSFFPKYTLHLGLHLLLIFLFAQVEMEAHPRVFSVQDEPRSREPEGRLESGRPIEAELTGGQSHTYRITMFAGNYLQVNIDQRGIDVAVALYSPAGSKIREIDSTHRFIGPEALSVIAEVTGTYSIEIGSSDKSAKAGRYEVRIEGPRPATAAEKYRVTADALSQEAEKIADGAQEAKRKSIQRYYEALELYRKASDREDEAQALINIGEVHLSLGETQMALDKFNEALPIKRAVGDKIGAAQALNNLGMVNRILGEMQKALDSYNEALSLIRAAGDRYGEASMLNNLGVLYRVSGDNRKGLEKYNEALAIRRAIGDRSGEANALTNIGIIYRSLGESQNALDKFNEALLIKRSIGDRSGIATTLFSIGLIYQLLGDGQRALEKYSEALRIRQALGEKRGVAETLHGIAESYWSAGEMQKALDTLSEALVLRREVSDRIGEAATLLDIGTIHSYLGEVQKALETYNEVLPILRKLDNRPVLAQTFNNMAVIYTSIGETDKALEKLNEALPIWREMKDRKGESDAMLALGRIEQKRGDLSQARQDLEQAIGMVESLRSGITSQVLRASFFASRQQFYQAYIDVLLELHKQNPAAGFDAAALAASERARARSLLELLTEARADLRQGVDPSLLERANSLQQQLLQAKTAQVKFTGVRSNTDAADKEIASLTAEFEELEARIRASSPRYAALIRPQPLNLSEIQQQVLDSETLLLEYSLGDQASYLFLVSQTSIASYRLPKREEIQAAARRTYDLLTAPQPRPGESEADRQARINQARDDYWPQATALSRMLLGPVASQLGAKRLLIVADGALQYLPFGALPVPDSRERESGRAGERRNRRPISHSPALPLSRSSTPLMVEHEIVHLPSASTLAILRRELAGREPAPKAVAVIADPVFSSDDARVRQSILAGKTKATNEPASELSLALRDVRGGLTRLLMTRDEAEAILSVAPQNARLEALDFRASRATSTSWELSQYRIIHFATHGLLNSEHPQLSGLVLSLVDEGGQPQDGFLQLHEIFKMRLRAELVVLSACQTGLGKEIKGEGLVGLTRGFMYAGAARVVASLWQVNDAATAELMKLFYRRMLQEGMPPAMALRAAQIEMWKKPQWQSPFYWGAFVLQGEWR
jgi:CHAT domain-containing protein/tetratricopeptide (TPR) repeat protein